MSRTGESGGQPGDPRAKASVPAETAAAWRDAEARLFAGLLIRPDLYREAITVVGETVSRLRQLGSSTGDLLQAAATISAAVAALVEADRPASDGIDPELLGGAALAMRHRELVAEQSAEHRLAKLEGARGKAVAWLVLEESGDPSGDPYFPYRRLEAEPVNGRGILVTTHPDDAFVASRHSVEVVRIDLTTGRVAAAPDGAPRPSTFADAADREAQVALTRTLLSRGS